MLNFFNEVQDTPDPGPKTYICFGLYNAPHLASTPLHLDVSEAVNFLPLVRPPDFMSREEIREVLAVEKRLQLEGFDEEQKMRALRVPEKAGAIWKIFHPDDNEKLRAIINDWKKMRELNAAYLCRMKEM
ncbi:unnamed protein product [Gongylonema pulchrum]|uniref:JmjC domain-containing protein n=1 Tax=Gongylonema pulchrum TaxID=637853 RepID=A0A183EZW9_9BILA|nr:unnamed protein product [Gongylonema pulchrum]